MQGKISNNSILILERLKKKLDITKDIELASNLNVKQNTLSTWKGRDAVDYKKIIDLCEEKGFDLNFIFYGSAQMQMVAESTSEYKANNSDKLLLETVQKVEDLEGIVSAIKLKLEIEDKLKGIKKATKLKAKS